MGELSKKSLIALIALMLFAGVLLAQTAPIVGPNETVGFDYSDADLTTYAVTRFEAAYDGAPYATVQTTAVVLSDTPAGAKTYKLTLPFSSGTHTVVIRACRLEGCGGGSVPFAFAFPVVNPNVPTHVRKVPK